MSDASRSPLVADSLKNLITGLGTGKDKSQAAHFYGRPRLGRGTTDALYSQNWLAGKIVDAPVEDQIREWRNWQGSKRTVEALEEAERRWKLQGVVAHAMKLAYKDGGAAILIGVASDDPAEPLNTATMGRNSLSYLHAVSRWDLSFTDIERDPVSAWFGRPREYRLMDAMGRAVGIHPSRVLPFVPIPRLDLLAWGDPWGDSVYERLYEPIRDAIAGFQGVAAMFQEAKVDVISIPNLSANVSNDAYRGAVLQRFGLANMLKSISNTLLMDATEKWDQKTLTFTGHPEVLDRLLQVVAGAADMPVTRLLGKSPAGLNSTGEADLQHYYDMISSRQKTFLQPALAPLDEILIRTTLGRQPRGTWFNWRPLYSLSAPEQADVNLKNSTAVKQYAETGLFSQAALAKSTASQLSEDGFLPAIEENAAADPAPEPVVVAPPAPGQPRQSEPAEPPANPA